MSDADFGARVDAFIDRHGRRAWRHILDDLRIGTLDDAYGNRDAVARRIDEMEALDGNDTGRG